MNKETFDCGFFKVAESPAWQRSEGKNPEGGLNAKGRASYNRSTGGHLKAPQPEGGPRKDSFCARMKGMKRKLTSSETANDPDSRINKALRKWKCGEATDAIQKLSRCWEGYEPVSGKEPYSEGSCRPASHKGKKQTEKVKQAFVNGFLKAAAAQLRQDALSILNKYIKLK